MLPASDDYELLHCSICMERFDDDVRKPKLLLCHHTFCLKCLVQCAANTQARGKGGHFVTCPICRKVTSISKKGVAALQDNFYLEPHIRRARCLPDELFQSDDDDDDIPTSSTRITKIWCETCMKVADMDCTAHHDICNYETGVKRLEVRLKVAMEGAHNALDEEISLLEAQLKLLQCAISLFMQLEERTSAAQITLATARSYQDALPQHTLSRDPTVLLGMARIAEKHQREASARTKPLVSQLNLASALQRSTINVHSGDSSAKDVLFTLKLDELEEVEKKAVSYMLCQILMKMKGNSSNKGATLEEQDTCWHLVDRSRRSKSTSQSTSQSNSSQLFTNTTTTTTTATTTTTTSPAKKGFLFRKQSPSPDRASSVMYKPLVVVNPDIGLSKKTMQCYLDIAVNGHMQGRVVFTLRPDVAPKMCRNFLALCEGHLGYGYRGSRIFKGHPNDHVIGGDIENNDGTGGYSIYNRKLFLADESGLKDEMGAVRMRGMGTDEETGVGRVGSQFHIWVGDRNFRSYRRTLVIGLVTEGLELLQSVSRLKTTKNARGVHVFSDVIIIQACGKL